MISYYVLQNAQYPNINVDFRKLDRDALVRLINYYHVKIPSDLTDAELAATVARIFQVKSSSEHEVVDKFAAKFCYSQSDNSVPNLNTAEEDEKPSKKAKSTIEYHHFHPASVGEQVNRNIYKC